MPACTFNSSPKVSYSTRREASFGKMRYQKKTGEKLLIYQCIKCKSFHIGHKPYWIVQKQLLKKDEAMVGKLIGVMKLLFNKNVA